MIKSNERGSVNMISLKGKTIQMKKMLEDAGLKPRFVYKLIKDPSFVNKWDGENPITIPVNNGSMTLSLRR